MASQMTRAPLNFPASFLLLILLWLAACSEHSSILPDAESLELTEQSLSSFSARLTGGLRDPLVAELQNCPAVNASCQQICLKYLIGSVAVFGKADEGVLAVIRELCSIQQMPYLSSLSAALVENNKLDAVAWFVARSVGDYHECCIGPFMSLVIEMAEKRWSAVGALIMRALTILRCDGTHHSVYRFMLRRFSLRLQYKLIDSPDSRLSFLEDICSICEMDPLLKERLTCKPLLDSLSQRFYNFNYSWFPRFKQLLDDRAEHIASSCSKDTPTLIADVWDQVFKLLDTGTLFAIPFVCKSWGILYSGIVMHHAKIHDAYLLDLRSIRLNDIHAIAPWKYCLHSRDDALRYLGQCIAEGVLDRIGSELLLQHNVREYLEAVMGGRVPLPKFEDCITQYDAFLRLFETVNGYRAEKRPVFEKPDFLTDREYEQAIHCLAYGKKLIVKLPKPWIADNMSKLFQLVREDEELMKKLVLLGFGNFMEPSLVLIMHGQEGRASERLVKLILSQIGIFKEFIDHLPGQYGEYYEPIVELGILLGLTVDSYWADRFGQLVMSLVLFFRTDQDKIDKIVASMVKQFSYPSGKSPRRVRRFFKEGIKRLLQGMSECSPEDVEFVEATVARFKCSEM